MLAIFAPKFSGELGTFIMGCLGNCPVSVVFCGRGALLIECADRLVSKGGVCSAVISDCADVRRWAETAGIAHLGTMAQIDLAQVSCDWLLSIGNPWVIPSELLEKPARGAINVHDGPLPGYAGLNAPVWAILDGASSYAVTWHEMTERVNAGPVIVEQPVSIEPDETSFSLNMKCYQAALASFDRVIERMQAGALSGTPQTGDRIWYPRTKKPPFMGMIDPRGTWDDVTRLLRALDFGTARNTVAMASLWTGSAQVFIGGWERAGATGTPGTILAADETGVTLGLSDGAIRFTGLTDWTGAAIVPAASGLSIGTNLPDRPAPAAVAMGDDRFYAAAFSDFTAALPPYPMEHGAQTAPQSAPLTAGGMTLETLAAGFLAWVSGLTGQQVAASIAVPGDHPSQLDLRPVAVAQNAQGSGADLQSTLSEAISHIRAQPAPSRDLALRSVNRETAVQVLGVVLGPDGTALADAQLLVTPSRLVARGGVYAQNVLEAMAGALSDYLSIFQSSGDAPLGTLALSSVPDLAHPGAAFPQITVHQAIAEQVAKTPQRTAFEADGAALSYADFDARATMLAQALSARGAGPGKAVGLCLDRSFDLVIAQMAILKTGAAYLPLDPGYPADRIHYMIEDSGTDLIVADEKVSLRLGLDPARVIGPDATAQAPITAQAGPDDLAVLIYTSGSTGKPKGVMVPHKTIVNFMTAMDEVVPHKPDAKLLAVTSVCFDISVLELFWTVSRGITAVLQTDVAGSGQLPGFSLFYFASEAEGAGHHAYRLLLEGAKFADKNGFEAVWTPERHFHAFGGLYPNPTISSTAVAAITENIHVRAGSFVLPLHHPVRAAEDWALVDNLSNGRTGVALASGWQPNDFVTRPENFENRKQIMLDNIAKMRAMWRGESQVLPGHDGKDVEFTIHPKPVRGEIPLWLTVAGNPETFAAAGEHGCNVLTHLLGQSFEEVAEKLAAYRAAWREAGHPGMGKVTMMLHTFISEDESFVRETAREPMKSYLKSSVDLLKKASWSTPLIVEKSQTKGMSPAEMFEQKDLTQEETEALLDHAFERYYQTSGLFGTPQSAKAMVRSLTEIGVDEIACLIDFGIDTDVVLENLPHIKSLMTELEADDGLGRKASLAELILDNGVTHFQCTPPMASFLAADAVGNAALAQLEVMMVGGEAFPPELAKSMRAAMSGMLLNMYGPTETTVWSSTFPITDGEAPIELGKPVANTTISIRSSEGRALPPMVEGELWIGGDGVTNGYWQRPDLTAERFVQTPQGRFYRTGDLARRTVDDRLEFLGRLDTQVKIRGYRIELGEIEARLAEQPGIAQAIVNAVTFGEGDQRLVGYVTGNGPTPDGDGLIAKLADNLPEFMLPSQIVILDAMPLTPNGKIDRKALPHPRAQVQQVEVSKVENELEETIAAIWRDALGLEDVSTTANFFDLGGHSLLTVQVQRRIAEALGRDVSITDVFRYSTIRSLAGHLSGGEAASGTNAAARGAARASARRQRRGRV